MTRAWKNAHFSTCRDYDEFAQMVDVGMHIGLAGLGGLSER